MRVLVSGQAGIAVVLDEPRQVRALDKEPIVLSEGADPRRLFDGCTDIVAHFVADINSIDALTEAAWERDRALRFFLLIIDPDEPREFLDEYCDCLADFVENQKVFDFIVRRVLSAPPPVAIEYDAVRIIVDKYQRVAELIQTVMRAQESLLKAEKAFRSLSPEFFVSPNAKSELYSELKADGSIADVVINISNNADIGLFRLKLANKYLKHKSAVMQWTAMLQSGFKKITSNQIMLPEQDELWEDFEFSRPNFASAEAFKQVKFEQLKIIECLKERNVDYARNLAESLISAQRSMSSGEQIAKTLSLLAQEAKLHEVPELQLEWAERATRENPADPKTFGHLSDALIALWRFTEAYEALESAEAVGGRMFAQNGRARILRIQGDYQGARTAYLSTCEEFDEIPGVEHSYVGAADALRDMGLGEAAVAEFRVLTRRFPMFSGVWTGLANALMDIGRLDDAIVNFGKSNATARNTGSKNGRANALRYAGNFDAAIEIYEEIIADFPNNSTALCGRAEVLRARGQLDAALEAYEVAISRVPFSPIPVNGKCLVLLELGMTRDALNLYESTSRRFPYDETSAVGLAKTHLKLGDAKAALRLVSLVISQSPFFVDAKNLYAKIHRYTGNYPEALRAYDAITSEFAYNQSAVIGKASLLVSMDRFEEADKLLPSFPPKTSRDWTRFSIRASIIAERQGKSAAIKWLSRGLEQCPFFQQRKLIRSSLASIEIGRGRVEEAKRVVLAAPSEISNVVAFHVYAASKKKIEALNLYGKVLESSGNNNVIDLVKEIARKYDLIAGRAVRDRGWIERSEKRLILYEAA